MNGEHIEMTPGTQAGELIVRRGNRIERLFAIVTGTSAWIFLDGRTFQVPLDGGATTRRRSVGQGSLTAPMPATVIAIKVSPGDTVAAGDVLVLLEAMKMELPVRAPGDGRVSAVHCAVGDLVQPDVSLIDLE
jgi:acetyl/propionyl-CoA carboxylase alpha subunit